MNIITTPSVAPHRVMLYGVAGVGKTTWAACAPAPVFIQTEDGLGSNDAPHFPLAQSLDDVLRCITELYQEEHDRQTVVIDSLDWLERLIWAEVCKERAVRSIEDIGYGKGYTFAINHWRDLLDGLTALRTTKDMATILVAHAKIERFENPETEPYDRYVPRLHRTAAAMVAEWCDEVLFANYRVLTRAAEGAKKSQGIGTGERILRTTERPAHIAKNRLNMPDELPLVWGEFAKYLPTTKA